MTDITLDKIKITVDSNDTDYNEVCNNLYEYNVRATNGLLKKPGKDTNGTRVLNTQLTQQF